MDHISINKSVWKSRRSSTWKFICPLCRADRRVPFRGKPGAWHFFQVGLTSIVLALMLSPWLKWKGIVCFLPLWIIFETVYRLKVRAVLNCPHCGFDPYLFLTDSQKARQELDTYWKNKIAEKGITLPNSADTKSTNPLVQDPKKSQLSPSALPGRPPKFDV
jgi:hypothetical protein